jgi:hypothetical protein
VPYERITRVYGPLAVVAVTFWPASIITTVPHVLVRGLTIASGAATERPRIVVISIARPEVRLPPVVPVAIIIGAASVAARAVEAMAFVITRINIARIEIHIACPGLAAVARDDHATRGIGDLEAVVREGCDPLAG